MTSQDEHVFPYYRSPQSIRNESFTHRMRGLDENEVRDYLALLADQVEAVEWERTQMVAEVKRLRAVDAQRRENPQAITPGPAPSAPDGTQAAAVLTQAQEVADQLLDAASHRAQEIIAAAQRQAHEVVHHARIMTQDRMQSLYDELDGEFMRLGEAFRPSARDGLPAPRRYDI